MKKDIKAFLKNIKILPINKKHWHTFNINHTKPIKDERKKIKKAIINEIGNLSGIYIYKNKSSRVLYIGKGNPLKNRFYLHYRASFESVPGDTKTERWHRFWLAHKGKLTVYWKKVRNYRDQKVIEQMLEYVLAPKFIGFK